MLGLKMTKLLRTALYLPRRCIIRLKMEENIYNARVRERMTKEEIAEGFSVGAADYEKTWLGRGYKDHVYVAQGVADFFKEGQRSRVKIMDVAAGTGLLCEELRRHGFTNIDGLDPSEGMRRVALEKGVYQRYFLEFMNGQRIWALQTDAYDCVVAAAAFNGGLLPCAALLEMARMVRPGGLICFGIPNSRFTEVTEYHGRLLPLMTAMEERGVWQQLSGDVFGDFYDGVVEGTVFRYKICVSETQKKRF